MAKLLIWLFTLAGVAVPLLFSVALLSTLSRVSIPSRYEERPELGGDPHLHHSYFYVEIWGQRYGMNSSSFPPLIIIVGIVLIIVGLFLTLHVNTGVSWKTFDSN